MEEFPQQLIDNRPVDANIYIDWTNKVERLNVFGLNLPCYVSYTNGNPVIICIYPIVYLLANTFPPLIRRNDSIPPT